MMILGDKEAETGTVTIRISGKDLTGIELSSFIKRLRKEIEGRRSRDLPGLLPVRSSSPHSICHPRSHKYLAVSREVVSR